MWLKIQQATRGNRFFFFVRKFKLFIIFKRSQSFNPKKLCDC